jgi:hypothetical protein
MELDTFLLADAATVTPDGKMFVHGGGLTRIAVPALPWTQPQLALVMRFRMEESDWDAAHQLQVSLAAPDGTAVIPPGSIEVPVGNQPETLENEESFLQIALSIASVPFLNQGIYTFRLALDGEPRGSLSLAVIGAEASGRDGSEDSSD